MSQPEDIPTGSIGGPLSRTRPVTYEQARRQLQSVRARLSHTIQDYLAACQLVRTTCSATPQSSYPTTVGREQALLAIDVELSTFSAEEAGIRKAREILTDTRNLSKMIAPIYTLPSEVLARIFSEATCYCASTTSHETVVPILSPVTLSAVCRQWRKVATHHRSLWTHLDLEVSRIYTHRGYHSPDIWKKHSQGAALYISIRQYRSFGDGDTDSDDDYLSLRDDAQNPAPMVARLLDFLLPLMCQVCSMTLVLGWPKGYIVTKLLDCWTTHGSPENAKALKIDSNPEFTLLDIPASLPYTSVLRSLEVLHFRNIAPPWLNWPFRNLVDLRLEARTYSEDWPITQFELASMLRSCPKLQYLEFSGFKIERSLEPTLSPAALNELQVLNIWCTTTQMLASLLAVIAPGTNPLRLEISLFYGCTNLNIAFAALHLFLERSNVTTFYLVSSNELCFASQIGPLPRVQTLVLTHCYFSDVAKLPSYTQDPTVYVNPRPVHPESVIWPELRALYLENCILEKEHLYQLVSHHSIQTLNMRDCYQGQQANKEFVIDAQTSGEYVQFLSELVPKVAYFTGEQGEWPLLSN
ncbi:hypothetical protein FRC08_010212 [Ceratobasidium sp. 394]|nr:hypothetical protein FRC08_010212 [Ceratobasidium sp. 394]KAG9089137.1 hypothetical protein FS749_001591 [Ceratobasidium sp. UAMH 11750]